MSRNIRTLRDFNNDDNHDSGEESDQGQEFYVGGSEQSGQQVLGGPRDRNRDFLSGVFEAVRRAGAEEMPAEELQQEQRSSQFVGSGMRLGRPGDPQENVTAQQPSSNQNQNNIIIIRMNIWENGFSLDDGPLRDLKLPPNQQFLREVMQGRIPRELTEAHPRQEIDLRIEEKHSPYIPPKSKPFDGTGARLGGVVPDVVTYEPPAVPQMTPRETEDALTSAQAEVKLDLNAPVTQLQIRLQNGKRLIGKFNHNHTVSTVRAFVVTAHPDLAYTEFQLMTTYPNKIIEDETISLADAGLLNAVVAIKPVA